MNIEIKGNYVYNIPVHGNNPILLLMNAMLEDKQSVLE